jgi:hypothetical protein
MEGLRADGGIAMNGRNCIFIHQNRDSGRFNDPTTPDCNLQEINRLALPFRRMNDSTHEFKC